MVQHIRSAEDFKSMTLTIGGGVLAALIRRQARAAHRPNTAEAERAFTLYYRFIRKHGGDWVQGELNQEEEDKASWLRETGT